MAAQDLARNDNPQMAQIPQTKHEETARHN